MIAEYLSSIFGEESINGKAAKEAIEKALIEEIREGMNVPDPLDGILPSGDRDRVWNLP